MKYEGKKKFNRRRGAAIRHASFFFRVAKVKSNDGPRPRRVPHSRNDKCSHRHTHCYTHCQTGRRENCATHAFGGPQKGCGTSTTTQGRGGTRRSRYRDIRSVQARVPRHGVRSKTLDRFAGRGRSAARAARRHARWETPLLGAHRVGGIFGVLLGDARREMGCTRVWPSPEFGYVQRRTAGTSGGSSTATTGTSGGSTATARGSAPPQHGTAGGAVQHAAVVRIKRLKCHPAVGSALAWKCCARCWKPNHRSPPSSPRFPRPPTNP
jgi:hypothetical protein